MKATGERVTTSEGGFNPTWQRHVAAYALCAPLLPDGELLDLGCGIGHSSELLGRPSVGVDIEPAVLTRQRRKTVVADMRDLPFADASFDAVICVQAIEHVPDPEAVLEETRRILRPGGRAVFVTPNRLTFGLPEEIIDPYHYVEFSAPELRRACESRFERVELLGLFGSPRYLEIVRDEGERLSRLLRLDPLGARRLLPRWIRARVYDLGIRRLRRNGSSAAERIEPTDFELRAIHLDEALDVVAICHREESVDQASNLRERSRCER